ncbi:MAG: YihY/virulence factor BrkB family protein, partial [Myxococcales bacterium]|nr:YihY/virulence factor BrkB family protein [Myxococcales bacterium]
STMYGALEGTVVLLLWIYLSSYIAIIGAEMNAHLENRRSPQKPKTTR